MKHSKHRIQRSFTVFSLITLFLLSFNEIQAETLPQKEAEPLISCSFDASLLKSSSLIKVECPNVDNYSGFFEFNGDEYMSSSGYLVLSGNFYHIKFLPDGKIDQRWTKERFKEYYPLLNNGVRDRTKLLEYDPTSIVFQTATLIEETTGLQINYGKDNEFAENSLAEDDERELLRMLEGVQAFADQFPDRFFKDTLPGVNISLVALYKKNGAYQINTQGVTSNIDRANPKETHFPIILTGQNETKEDFVSTLNHEIGHVFDFYLGNGKNHSAFTDVIDRLGEIKRSDYYVYDHGVTSNRHKDTFKVPDQYSMTNDFEYIGRLFEYMLTSGYEYLFKEGTFYRQQADLALERLYKFDPDFQKLPINFN